MTTTDQMVRSLRTTKQFLQDLIDPKRTPRVPKDIRDRARLALRHYPDDYLLDGSLSGLLNEWLSRY